MQCIRIANILFFYSNEHNRYLEEIYCNYLQQFFLTKIEISMKFVI